MHNDWISYVRFTNIIIVYPSTPNPYIETSCHCEILGDVPIGRWSDHASRALLNRIHVLSQNSRQLLFLSSHLWKKPSAGCHQIHDLLCFDVGIPNIQTWERFLVCKSSILWHFVIRFWTEMTINKIKICECHPLSFHHLSVEKRTCSRTFLGFNFLICRVKAWQCFLALTLFCHLLEDTIILSGRLIMITP